MDTALTIEEFNALLASETPENPLITALRKLTLIEKPEDIAALIRVESGWTGWGL